MVNPVPGYSISTAYGVQGSAWGAGWHDGADYAAPGGTDVVAMWGGTVVEAAYPTSFGSAFGRAVVIDHDKLPDGSPGLWALYAHLSAENVSVGQRVEAGQKIGDVGTTGNSSGNHCHVGVYAQPSWCSGCGKNPQPWIDAGGGSSGGGGGGGGSEYPVPTSNTVYVSKLKYGQEDSDSVWYLQDALNDHPLSGGATLPLTGGYFDMTDAEVIKCQTQHGFGADAAGSSFVGPSQAEHLFAGRGIDVHYDTGNPSQPPPTSGSGGGELPQAPALLYPGAIWDPIEGMSGLRPFAGSAHKVTLHTTETSVKPNWQQQKSGIPHLTVDLEGFVIWQHLAFDQAAYTLSGGDNSPNSDSGVNIQIEMIGYAGETDIWDDTRYENLREVLTWISANLGVPYVFPVDFPPASRLDWNEWEGLSGILGHSMAPYNDHSDPGALDVDRLVDEQPPIVEEDVYVTVEEYESGQAALDEMLREIKLVIEGYLQEE